VSGAGAPKQTPLGGVAGGDRVVADRNREVFNAFQEGDDHLAGALKAERIAQVLATISPRRTVGDIGCHNGAYTALYAQVPGVEMIEGFDVAEKALDEVRARGFRAYGWVAGSEPCPRESGAFDVLIAGDIIEHVVNTEHFVSEMKRILRPGGHVILTTPNLYYWLNRVKFLFGKTPWDYPGVSQYFKRDRNINTEHIRVNGLREWQAFFDARGFQVCRADGLRWVPPTTLKRRVIHLIDSVMPASASCLSLFVLRKTDAP
jgi:2-polyprenyl-3-methyl-5-hydroxy-6-metoxy-1,4-benzoquinol methylase